MAPDDPQVPHLETGRSGGPPRQESASPPSDAETDPAGGAARRCARVVRASTYVVIGLVACGAVTLILMLVGAYAYTQLGPGGVMSSIRVGEPAPDFEMPMLGGGTVTLSQYRGQPVILNFWATYCKRCVKELPALAAAEADHADENLVVITVNPNQVHRHVEEFLAANGIGLPVAFDVTGEVWRLYRIVALPTTVWIDSDGIVRAVTLDILTAELIDRYVAEITETSRT